jgi:hypothetical protein
MANNLVTKVKGFLSRALVGDHCGQLDVEIHVVHGDGIAGLLGKKRRFRSAGFGERTRPPTRRMEIAEVGGRAGVLVAPALGAVEGAPSPAREWTRVHGQFTEMRYAQESSLLQPFVAYATKGCRVRHT